MKKTLKIKILSAILLFTLCVSGLTALNIDTAHGLDSFWDIFKTDDGNRISFTEYAGGLATLDETGYEPALTTSSDLREFIITIVNYALSFLGLIAVIFVIYGGVLYVTSAGEDEKVTKGKKVILYAAIGLLIILGSYAFVNTVIGATGRSGGIGGGITAPAGTGGGFNSSSEQVKALASEIYNGFVYLADVTEELKNLQTEASKSSLDPARLPAKSDILSFLYGMQSGLNSMKNTGVQFSDANTEIANQLRNINLEIDRIRSLNITTYAKPTSGGTNIDYCDPDQDSAWYDIVFGINPCEGSGYVQYTQGLFETWNPLRENIVDGSGNKVDFGKIAELVANDYYESLEGYAQSLGGVYGEVSNIEAISAGAASNAYNKMKEAYGYAEASPDFIDYGTGNNFMTLIKNWKLGSIEENPIPEAYQYLRNALRYMLDFYNELIKLQYVQARITADTVEGSAPLTVIFDALATNDPAGGSLDPQNILWDLSGTMTTEDLLGATNYGIQPMDEGNVTCERPTAVSGEELLGATSQRCTFHSPGTYRAAIKIKSNESTRYAPGISVITIRVRPRTTKIHLDVTPAGNQLQNIISYLGDTVLNDRRVMTVTLNEASNGITFDASKTQAAQYRWTFGNGEVVGYSTNGTVENYKGYNSAGKYEVILEVLSELGVVDRKIFTMEVSSLAARLIRPQAREFLINTPIIFDASGSRSDTGTIREYSWEIVPVSAQLPADINDVYPFTQSGPGLTTLTHEFKYPVEYDIKLVITDDSGNKASDSITGFKVKSASPVALYNYSIPKQSQPGTVHFDGSESFDPDGDKEYLTYSWTISAPDTAYKFLDDTAASSPNPIVKFLEKGDYEVSLKVSDSMTAPPNEEWGETKKTISMENVLDVAWGEGMEVTSVLDEDGRSQIDFVIVSDTATAYELDFGNGDITTGNMTETRTVPYTYTEEGKYEVKLTVFNEDDEDTTIKRRVFIGGGDNPLAKISILVDGVRIDEFDETIEANKKNIITFDASQSKNIDGTGRKLLYSWDFGDTTKSSKKNATHTYSELSPEDPGYFEVKLRVIHSERPELIDEDTVQISVKPIPPIFASIQAVPRLIRGDMTTPLTVLLKAYGAKDEDGEITQFRWWYYDVKRPDDPLGMQITSNDTAQMIIGTNGREGQEITYGFGLQITDTDNLKFSTNELYEQVDPQTITVVNGPNELPTARFNVSATKVFAGEEITFTSASTDPDGNIVKYIWDYEGDGFFNNEPTDQATVKHIYTKKNLDGYDVKLKVVDDKGGEAISPAVKIYIDVVAENPVAAFTYEATGKADGKEIKFINNSKADTEADAEIISDIWDFDTASNLLTADSDGDGIKDNDEDSTRKNPTNTYLTYGEYKVKLTVMDNYGNTSSITNSVNVINPNAPPPTTTTAPVESWTTDTAPLEAGSGTGITGESWTPDTAPLEAGSGTGITGDSWTPDTAPLEAGSGTGITGESWTPDTAPLEAGSSVGITGESYVPGTESTATGLMVIPEEYIIQPDTTTTTQPGTTTTTTQPGTTTTTTQPGTTTTATQPGTTTTATQPTQTLNAILTTYPPADNSGRIYLNGDFGMVTFDFSNSTGLISYYIFDKNIFADTDGNGIKDDDEDFKTTLPGSWTTNFSKAWGQIVVKFTVTDIYGNKNSITREIKFN